MSITEKKEQADIILREMGLIDAVNTRVGGWSSKGLSGGQKILCFVIDSIYSDT
jgi:hypothetical protein